MLEARRESRNGDDNLGSHAVRRHFVAHCEVTLPIVFEFSKM